MTTKMKDITITTATIDFGDWNLTATGVLDEFWDWRIVNHTPAIHYSSEWKVREYFSDREELEAFMWAEVQSSRSKTKIISTRNNFYK
jgi:hypothetical protein